jgi:tetratricopeptide (TPR) repeat protein
VTDRPYETAQIADIEGSEGWSPIRRRMGVGAFGINAWTAHQADERLIPGHDEVPSGHEELYLVTSGHAAFTVAGDEVDAPAGTIVFVRDPAARREAWAREAGTTVVAVGGRPGSAYRPRAWESNREVLALFDAGEFAEARDMLTDALDRYEDRGTVLYNLACAEAQLGQTDSAAEHLLEAVREQPSLAEHAGEDSDLEPIRSHPRFAEAIGGRV